MSTAKVNVFQNIGILFLVGVYQINAQYVVDVMRMTTFGEEELVHKCAATGGNFGKDVTDFIISDENLGCAVSVEPADACGPVRIAHNHTKTCHNLFAFVSRSDHAHPCKFSHQAFMVQNSSYPFRLVIFYNYPGQDPISMEGTDLRDKVYLPVLMISHACKEDIARKFSDIANYRLRVRIDPGYYELFRYLIPFLVVIVFCFALFMITLCVRGCVERRKLNKRRLSKRNLKKIPVKKYRSGDDPDTCAICLESFIPGEKLRHLPCKHVFHCKCIDVWLTQTRKVCPLCKRKIGSDTDSECSNDLFGEDTRGNFAEGEDYQGVEEFAAAPTSQTQDMWSSQEALVDQDIVLMGSTRRTITGFVRNAVRKMRHGSQRGDEENGVGLENNAYLVRQQATSSDSDNLLENEASNPTSCPTTSTFIPTTSDETLTTNDPNTCTSSSTFPTC